MVRETSSNGLTWACALALATGIVLGGGTANIQMTDAIVEALCLPILLGCILRYRSCAPSAPLEVALLLSILMIALPMMQLIPLAPSVWSALPGREAATAGLRLAGVELPWMGVSLSPISTRQSALSLLPGISIFLCVSLMSWRARRLTTAVLLAITLACLLLGALQSVHGPSQLLRFYYPDDTDVVGPFANRNHFAALLYAGLLIAMAWTVGLINERGKEPGPGAPRSSIDPRVALAIALSTVCVLLFGLVLVQSRAGLGLGVVALMMGGLLFFPTRRGQGGRTLVVGVSIVIVVVLLASVNVMLFDLVQRLRLGIADTFRPVVAEQTRHLISTYFPLGSGFGTFERVYAFNEQSPTALPFIANRAHNEFLEWSLEGGALAWVFIGPALCWLLWVNVTAWRRANPTVDSAIQRASAFVPILFLAHSLVDYPLRTVALMSVAAMCAAMCVAPAANQHRPA